MNRSAAVGGLALSLFFLASEPLVAKKNKFQKWEIGTVLDVDVYNTYTGSTSSTSDSGGRIDRRGSYESYGTRSSTSANYATQEVIVIETATHILETSRRLRRLWAWGGSPAELTVNGSVDYSIHRRMIKIRDDHGKEHKFFIVKRILKRPR